MNKDYETGGIRFSPQLLVVILIAVFFGVALYLRVCPPFDQVFSGDWIKFTSVDAYRHMRQVDNFVYNFPHFFSFDPYLIYHEGIGLAMGKIHFFDWLLGGIIWIIGLGSPTQHTVDVVGAYFPAVLGALCVVPVYFIGKELFNRWAGVIAAGLIALLPGEFLGRSILGFTDHHVAEVLFSTTTILFLILAIKAARQRQVTFDHIKHRDWATLKKPVIYSLFTGIFLGIYLLSWTGGLFFVFVIALYLVIQSIIDHLRRQPIEYLCLVGVILFLVALLIYLPALRGRIYPTSMVIALLTPLILTAISRLMIARKIKPVYYPLSLLGVGLVGMGIIAAISPLVTSPTQPPLLNSMLSQFGVFAPAGVQLATLEMQPILFPAGEFSFRVVWANFTTSIFLSLIAFGFLIYFVIKQRDAGMTLLIVWSLVMLAATLGQRRFAYYFAVNVALLTGYISWRVLVLAGLGKPAVAPTEIPAKGERGKTRLKKRTSLFATSYLKIAFAVIVIFFLVFFPNIRPAITTASQARFAPDDAWCDSLTWLKENSPEPFGDPEYYYQLYQMPAGESYKDYEYPESAYGVMAWWDYGFWITRIGHRLPVANPGQATEPVVNVARCFIAQDEDSASEIVEELNSPYLIIDFTTVTQKFWAIATWAGKKDAGFHEPYYLPTQEDFVMLFYPEYYQSLAVRLYNFDGRAVTPEKTYVISFKESRDREGETYKQITSSKSFTSYEEAATYLSQQESDNYRIIGINPFQSPVPLTAVEHYQPVYGSDIRVKNVGMEDLSAVKIFEYIK